MKLLATFEVALGTNVVRHDRELGEEKVFGIHSLNPKSLSMSNRQPKKQLTEEVDRHTHGIGLGKPNFHLGKLVQLGIAIIILDNAVNILSTNTTLVLSLFTFHVFKTSIQAGDASSSGKTDKLVKVVIGASTMDANATENHLDELFMNVGRMEEVILEIDISPMTWTTGVTQSTGSTGGVLSGSHLSIHGINPKTTAHILHLNSRLMNKFLIRPNVNIHTFDGGCLIDKKKGFLLQGRGSKRYSLHRCF
jgi:hypothetical protein